MKTPTKIVNSVLISSAVTLVDVAHKKIGGVFSGVNFSESHSWSELAGMTSDFVGLFIFMLLSSLFYFFIIRRPVTFICPKCGDKYETTNPSEAYCLDCDMRMVSIK